MDFQDYIHTTKDYLKDLEERTKKFLSIETRSKLLTSIEKILFEGALAFIV